MLPNIKGGKIDPNISRGKDLNDVKSGDLFEFVVPKSNPWLFRHVLVSDLTEIKVNGAIIAHLPYYNSRGQFKGLIQTSLLVTSREIQKFIKGA